MRRRIIAGGGIAAAVFTAAAAIPVSGQSGAPALVVTAYNGGAPIPYAVPKTPWGDPDLQGVWSSDDTGGIPLSRPQALGTQLYQTDEQFAARQKQIENGIKNGESAIGSFRGDFARRAFRQTSIVVDPPDGRMPAYTPKPRSAARRAIKAPSATVRSTRWRTSRCTTAASRAASSARCCGSSTATATASCRRRVWWRSATR